MILILGQLTYCHALKEAMKCEWTVLFINFGNWNIGILDIVKLEYWNIGLLEHWNIGF